MAKKKWWTVFNSHCSLKDYETKAIVESSHGRVVVPTYVEDDGKFKWAFVGIHGWVRKYSGTVKFEDDSSQYVLLDRIPKWAREMLVEELFNADYTMRHVDVPVYGSVFAAKFHGKLERLIEKIFKK